LGLGYTHKKYFHEDTKIPEILEQEKPN